MFDSLLRTKFYSKCKSDIKLTRTRLDMIMKKRKAMHKFLRNDVTHLLQNGLDNNAFARAEGLLVEMNTSSSYEFIEQCFVCVSTHLSTMDKQKECPKECREAVSSLMFAAARFADLPELRDLRTIFSDRYGNFLDCFVNKQFVEMFKPGLPSKDLKLQLLQDIALESGLQWNSKALENSLYKQAEPDKDFAKETSDDEFILRDDVNASFQKKDRYDFKNTREITAHDGEKELSYNVLKEDSKTIDRRLSQKTESTLPLNDIQMGTIRRNEKLNKTESLKSDPNKEEIENEKPLKYKSIPPPYTKSEVNKTKSSLRDGMEYSCNKKNHPQEDFTGKNAKPLAKSVRRNFGVRNSKENIGCFTEREEDKMKDINKEKAEVAQKILKYFDKGMHPEGKEVEEKIIDGHLRYYSRKNDKSELNVPTKSSKATKDESKDSSNLRSMSLPGETTPNETPKTHNRASSFHPGILNGNHVHPKLPDYDKFVAELAAYRRN